MQYLPISFYINQIVVLLPLDAVSHLNGKRVPWTKSACVPSVEEYKYWHFVGEGESLF